MVTSSARVYSDKYLGQTDGRVSNIIKIILQDQRTLDGVLQLLTLKVLFFAASLIFYLLALFCFYFDHSRDLLCCDSLGSTFLYLIRL